jgi:hypothetical protein
MHTNPTLSGEQGLFYNVDQAVLLRAYPAITDGVEAFAALVEANDAARLAFDSRRQRRQVDNANTMNDGARSFIVMGAQAIARHDDLEVGKQATSDMLVGLSEPLFARPIPGDSENEGGMYRRLWEKRCVPIAGPLQRIAAAGRAVAASMDATPEDDSERNYLLLKALATDPAYKPSELRVSATADWQPSRALIALSGIGESVIKRRLLATAAQGGFDSLIAQDMLRFTRNREGTTPDFARLRQLGDFAIAYSGIAPDDDNDFYRRMAVVLDTWPAPERQIVTDGRCAIQDALASNDTRMGSWLREMKFIFDGDPIENLADSIDVLITEALKREQLSAATRASLIAVRGTHKRAAVSSRTRRNERKAGQHNGEDAAAEEDAAQRISPVMRTIDLHNGTSVAGIDGLIEKFITDASQSDPAKIRTDLERMVTYMLRTDLPTDRRGVKNIGTLRLVYEPDGQPRQLKEFKPTDAPGLPTTTSVTKNLRFYLLELPGSAFAGEDDTIKGKVLGIVAIEPRAKQDATLKYLRDKAKRTPGSKQNDQED